MNHHPRCSVLVLLLRLLCERVLAERVDYRSLPSVMELSLRLGADHLLQCCLRWCRKHMHVVLPLMAAYTDLTAVEE